MSGVLQINVDLFKSDFRACTVLIYPFKEIGGNVTLTNPSKTRIIYTYWLIKQRLSDIPLKYSVMDEFDIEVLTGSQSFSVAC